ncbi:MAG: DUF4175 domain-containing protein [Planctomycetaceae bacterium]|jgi:hypothetical protein|nr:DUF4175 domain-containing protein [Planctomycetaceae bacterium]
MNFSSSQLPTIIFQKLRNLKRTLRIYAFLDGTATTFLAVIFLFWLDLGLDRFFELPQLFRGLILFLLLSGLGYFVWSRIIRRCCVNIRNDQLAAVFERFTPSLNESLITVVELDTVLQTQNEFNQFLFQKDIAEAAETLQNIRIRKFFRLGRIVKRFVLVFILTGIVTIFIATFTETSEIWFSRNILLSNQDWPRRSQLVVEGFDDRNGRIRIGRGDSFTLIVRANTAMPLVPETIRLRLGSRENGYRNVMIDQFRTEILKGTDWRFFSHTFTELLETLPIQVRGADSTINDLFIEVVPPPTLTEMKLKQKFPQYLERNDRTISVSGQMSIPDGTDITVTGTASKPLVKAETVLDRGEPVVLRQSPVTTPFDSLSFSLQKIRHDALLEFQLEDIDFLRNRQPIRIRFGIVKDQPPTVTARLDGIGTVITPNAVLPTSGEITDDNGLAAVSYRFEIERGNQNNTSESVPPENQPPANHEAELQNKTVTVLPEDQGLITITGVRKGQTVFPLAQEFSVSEISVQTGDKLSLFLEASDRFNLDGQTGQIGLGPRWTLEIVTPERLLSLLEVREISLRQRFEVLIGETERTKLLIEEFSLLPPEELIRETESLSLISEPLIDIDILEEHLEKLEAKKKTMLATISREQAATGLYNISRSLRDTQKEVYDLRTIIESFTLIRREMINNRIFSEDAKQRLERGIIQPMQELVDTDFPETDRMIDHLNQTLEIHDQPLRDTALEQQKTALDQFNLVIKKMTTIRDNMVSMESFNEAVDILRAIIKQQQQLRNETLEEKNKRLKNLLE